MAAQKAKRLGGTAHPLWYDVLSTLLLGTAAAFVLLLGCSWLLCQTDLPLYAAGPLATVAAGGGAMLAGLALARARNRRGLLLGLLQGGIFTVVLLGCLVLNGTRQLTAVFALRAACMIVSGCLGGCAAMVIPRKQKHPRSH